MKHVRSTTVCPDPAGGALLPWSQYQASIVYGSVNAKLTDYEYVLLQQQNGVYSEARPPHQSMERILSCSVIICFLVISSRLEQPESASASSSSSLSISITRLTPYSPFAASPYITGLPICLIVKI